MGWSQAVNHCTPTTGRGRTQKTQQESSDLCIPCNEHYRMFQMLWDSGERLVSHKVDFRGGALSFNLLSAEPTARPGRRTPTGTAWPRPTRARPCAVWSSQVKYSHKISIRNLMISYLVIVVRFWKDLPPGSGWPEHLQWSQLHRQDCI